MPNSSTICVDANLVFRFVADPTDESVRSRWRDWREARRNLIAPALLRYEVVNALHRLQRSGGATSAFVEAAWTAALALPIGFVADDELHRQALRLAGRFNLPAAYDAHYLALAEREGIEFFTADRRLANSVAGRLAWVRFVGVEPAARAGS